MSYFLLNSDHHAIITIIKSPCSFFLPARWPSFLGRTCSSGVFTLPHHFIFIHFLWIVDVHIWPLLSGYHPLLLFVVVQSHTQIL